MWSRRSFVAASCTISACLVTRAIASLRESLSKVGADWLRDAAGLALQNLNKMADIVLRLEDKVDILINVKATILDVRRKLTDSTVERHLKVKLAEWLKHYDAWVSNKPTLNESDANFAARHDRERTILNEDWHKLSYDAVGALKDIESLGYELQSIHSEAMSFEEWHKYTDLMDKEKMIIEVISSEMPVDPYVIDRLRDTAKQLEEMVGVIDTVTIPLKEEIKKLGGENG
jgi:hypothetical protein